MKKLIITSVALLCMTMAYGQKNEIYVGWGGLTHTDISNAVGAVGTVIGSLGTATIDMDPEGAFYVGYNRKLTRRISIGGEICYEPSSGHQLFDKQVTHDVDQNDISVMASGRFKWLGGKVISFYSKIAAGASFHNVKYDAVKAGEKSTTEEETNLAFQVSPIGLSVGGKHLRAFVELGYGYQGIFCIGLTCGF